MGLVDKIPKPIVLPLAGLATAGLMTLGGAYVSDFLSQFITDNKTLSNVVFGTECVVGSIIMKRPTAYALGEIYGMDGKLSFRHPIESAKAVWNNYHLRRDAAAFGASLIFVTGGCFLAREHFYDGLVKNGYTPKQASRKVDIPLNTVRTLYYNGLGIMLMADSLKKRQKKEAQAIDLSS